MRYYIQRHSHKIAKTVLLVVVLVVCGLTAKYFIANRGELGRVDDKGEATTQSNSSPASVSSRVLLAGDVAWGGHLYEISEQDSLKGEYGFSGLSTLSRNEYDAWVGNLNCTPVSEPPYSSENDCPLDYISEVKKWFNVFALGNDHVAADVTRTSLQSAGIQYVGDGGMVDVSNLCDVISLPARFTLGDGSFKAAFIPIALCSYNIGLVAIDTPQYREIEKYAARIPTVVYVSMNSSSSVTRTTTQESVYRSFIDMGADMVIGNNSYAVQSAESYKGKLIVYSLGNFIYPGSSSDAERYRGVSLKVVLAAKIDSNVTAWTSLANGCAQVRDTCLQLASSQGLLKPEYSYDVSIITIDSTSGLTRKSKGDWEEQAQKRLGWSALLPSLSYTKNL